MDDRWIITSPITVPYPLPKGSDGVSNIDVDYEQQFTRWFREKLFPEAGYILIHTSWAHIWGPCRTLEGAKERKQYYIDNDILPEDEIHIMSIHCIEGE